MNLTIRNSYLLSIFSIFTKARLPGFGVTEYTAKAPKGHLYDFAIVTFALIIANY